MFVLKKKQDQAEIEKDDTSFEADLNDSNLSPHILVAEKKEANLNSLRTNVKNSLSSVTEMNRAIAAQETVTKDILSLLDMYSLDIAREKRLKIEKQEMQENLTSAREEIQSQKNVILNIQSEREAQKRRDTKQRATLEQARVTFAKLTEKNYEYKNNLDKKSEEIVSLDRQNKTLSDKLEKTQMDLQTISQQHNNLQNDLEQQSKSETELLRRLAEKEAALESEIDKNKVRAGEIEALRRELASLTAKKIELKSDYNATIQELDVLKESREDDQQKFDNRLFTMKAEIESLSSERRLNRQSYNDAMSENSILRDAVKNAEATTSKLKVELETLHEAQSQERQQHSSANEKLANLNLRYNAALTDLKQQKDECFLLQQKLERLKDTEQRLDSYKVKHDLAVGQVAHLKTLVVDYQKLLEERNIEFEIKNDQVNSDNDVLEEADDQLHEVRHSNKTIQ